MGESQQLHENEWKFADLPWVCPQFALKFCHTYFYWIFHPQGVTFWHFFAVRAHIRIFLAFRIYINFYSIFKIVSDTMILLPKTLGAIWEQKVVFFSQFSTKNFGNFFFKSNLHHEGVILDQWGIKGANKVEIEGYSKLSSKPLLCNWVLTFLSSIKIIFLDWTE